MLEQETRYGGSMEFDEKNDQVFTQTMNESNVNLYVRKDIFDLTDGKLCIWLKD